MLYLPRNYNSEPENFSRQKSATWQTLTRSPQGHIQLQGVPPNNVFRPIARERKIKIQMVLTFP